MERTLCVWFPDWPLRRLDAPSDRPCQAVGDDNRVVAVNDLARHLGIEPGMRRRQAEALCPGVVTLAQDHGAEAAAFEPVVSAVEEMVPRVEVAHPGLLFAPVKGAVRYYGGERPLAERVAKEVANVAGPGARIGLAAGPFAAEQAAGFAAEEPFVVEDDAVFLAMLDVDALGQEELAATLRWLGIASLGELAALPRAAIASRFGTPGLTAHRLASGEDRDSQPRRIPEELAVEVSFEEPLDNLEQAAFVARSLAHRLMEALSPEGVAPHRVEVEAEAASGARLSRTWRSADPFREADLAERMRWQMQAWVESGGIPGGLVRLRLAPADVSGDGRQLMLAEDAASEAEAARALARAQALLGSDAVLQAQPQGGRDPADRVQWYRWGEKAPVSVRELEAPWPGKLPGPSPALVPPSPRPLEVEWDQGLPIRVRLRSRWEPILTWAGPWRRMGRWWEGEEVSDRYQLVTSAGAFLCEVRAGATFLVGVYD